MVWFYLSLGVCWLFTSIATHGVLRWLDLALSLSYLASAPYWVHVRQKILRNVARDAPVNGRAV
jgi:uncharacterized membrane protein